MTTDVMKLARLSCIVVACIIPSSAWSFLAPGCPCSAVSAYHGDTREHVTDETTKAATTIVEAMRAQTHQLSAYLDRQVEAAKRIANARQQNDTQRLRESIRAAAESGAFDPNPDSCLHYDMLGDHPGSGLELPVTTGEIITPVEQWTRGRSEPVRAGGTRLAAWLLQERKLLADSVGRSDPTSDWGIVLDEPSLESGERNMAPALSRLVTNTLDPVPPRSLTPQELKTPTGISLSVIRDSRKARLDAAIELVEHTLDMRVPTTDSRHYRKVAAASHYGGIVPDLISELQKLDIRTAFYAEPSHSTLDLRQAKNMTALLQDLIDITALNARINLQRLELASRNSIVNAAVLAIAVEDSTTGWGGQ